MTNQLYIAVPVRGSSTPILISQGPLTQRDLPTIMNRLVVPHLRLERQYSNTQGVDTDHRLSSTSHQAEVSDLLPLQAKSETTLSHRVRHLQHMCSISQRYNSPNSMTEMADIIDGIVNADGSPIFVVAAQSNDHATVPDRKEQTLPIRLGEWLRRQRSSTGIDHRNDERKVSPIATNFNSNNSIDALLASAARCGSSLSLVDPIQTTYNIKARCDL
jgi:hypothetical protein